MCYQIPGSITKSGKPIIGGLDIDRIDCEFIGKIYPKEVTPSPDTDSTSDAGASGDADKQAAPRKRHGNI